MDVFARLKCELACNDIALNANGVKIHGSEKDTVLSLKEAINHVSSVFQSNASVLIELWQSSIKLSDHKSSGGLPSNEITQRLFVAAVKHLAKQSAKSKLLMKSGVAGQFEVILSQDLSSFSEVEMNKLVEHRLAIDWLTHLVSYDFYRLRLLEVASALGADKDTPIGTKVAYGFEGANDPIIGERATPFHFLTDTIYDHQPSGAPAHERRPNQNNDFRLPNDDPMKGVTFVEPYANEPVAWEDRIQSGNDPQANTALHN